MLSKFYTFRHIQFKDFFLVWFAWVVFVELGIFEFYKSPNMNSESKFRDSKSPLQYGDSKYRKIHKIDEFL